MPGLIIKYKGDNMLTVKIYPKESEKVWFKLNFASSNFCWNDALKNGITLHTYSLTGVKYKYKDKAVKIEVLQ